MKELTKIAKLLGEKNEKRLKDGITDLMLEEIKSDLKNNSFYLIDFDELFDEIRDEIKDELKSKIRSRYIKMAEEKFSEMFEKED